MVESVYDYYCDQAEFREKLGPFIDRIELTTFKESVNNIYKTKEQ
jgi:dissimilatory sulfite reductase (desulfoviridin) alpha/beta subunit